MTPSPQSCRLVEGKSLQILFTRFIVPLCRKGQVGKKRIVQIKKRIERRSVLQREAGENALRHAADGIRLVVPEAVRILFLRKPIYILGLAVAP